MKKTKNFLWHFTEQLNLLYQSGIPLSQAFALLAEGKFQARELTMFKDIEHCINRGQSLCTSLKRYPEIFPKFYFTLIEVGETSGRLAEVLQDLTRALKEQIELKRKITAALFYPLTVLCINTLIVFALLWFIVPRYAELFAKNTESLPGLTKMLLLISAELHQFWWLNALLCTLALLGLRHIFTQQKYQQNLKLKLAQIYGLKTLIQLRDLALLCRNIALCLKAGLTLTQALKLCMPLVLNPKLQENIAEIINDIHRGKGINAAFKKHNFPTLMLQLLKIGEATGHLEQQFLKIAEIYEQDLARTLDKMTRLLEPIMMIVLGAIVGLIMYALYQPLLQLGTLV